MSKKRAIVFDWDGTLFDSMSYKRANIAELFAEKFDADQNLVNKIHHELSGLPRRKIFEAIMLKLTGENLRDDEFEALSKTFTDRNIESASKAALFLDAKEILPQLLSKNLQIFVSSSASQQEIDFAICHTQTASYFQLAFGSEGHFYKGEPHLLRFEAHAPCTRHEMLFIGDDEKDRQIAKSCHVDFLQIQRNGPVTQGDQITSLTAILQRT